MTDKYTQKPIVSFIEHKVAQSGEVFYVQNGKLLSCKDTIEFASIVDAYVLRQRADNHYNQYFSVVVPNDMTYKAPIRNRSYIGNAVKKLPLEEQMKVFSDYMTMLLTADQAIINLQGEYLQ
jgi:hypothetical protein